MDESHDSVYEIEIANDQEIIAIADELLRSAVESVLGGERIPRARISVAVVDDGAMHRLNRQYLDHDYPTDVLSFRLNDPDEELDGEIIVSADTAVRQAPDYHWDPRHEICLYIIHGTLHLVGFEDASRAQQDAMRRKEDAYLARLGMRRGVISEDHRS